MSLYGALYSGVSGLKAQSTKIGVISDNISNVNTVGYKGGSGLFQSLVTGSASGSSYSPGGVLGGNRSTISKQGLLQATDAPTDIAIQGGGFFVVNQAADQSGQVLYSRAGSFRQDSTGNFRNAAGFFLQAWPLDREGRLPGEPGNLNTTSSANLSSLRTVNVQNLTGVAAATSSVSIGANLKASQAVFPGAARTTAMDQQHIINFGIKGKDIIVPDDPLSPVNSIQRGDKFNITTGAGVTTSFRYGGFTYSRDVTTGAVGDSQEALMAATTTITDVPDLLATPFSVPNNSNVVTVTMANHGLLTGDSVTLTGNLVNVGNIPAGELNGSFIITKVDDNTFTIRTVTQNTAGAAGPVGTTGINVSIPPYSVTDTTGTIRARHVAHGLETGDVITLANNTDGIAGIPFSDLNGKFIVTKLDNDHFTFTAATTATSDTLLATPFSVGNNSNLVTVTHASHGFTTGDVVRLSGNLVNIGNIPAAELNGNFVVTVVDPNTYTIRTVSQNTAGAAGPVGTTGIKALDFNGGAGGITNNTRPFAGRILDASSPDQFFLGVTDPEGFTAAGKTFKITTASSGTVTFTYKVGSISAPGQFNNMTNLAAAINATNGLSARVVDGKLYVSATNANEAISFANGSEVGTAGPPVQASIDWVRELGLQSLSAGVDRFSTLEGLASLVNATAGLSATLINPTGAASLRMNVDDPLDTIMFADRPINITPDNNYGAAPISTAANSRVVTITSSANHGYSTGDLVTVNVTGGPFNGIAASALNGQQFEITVIDQLHYTITLPPGVTAASGGIAAAPGSFSIDPPTNSGSLLAELGLTTPSLNGGPFVAQSTGNIGPAYDPTDPLKSMTSGAIASQFSRPIRVFDSLGTGHDLSVNFLKIGINSWAVEVFALPASDVLQTNGQLASGTVTFNGDSSLASISAGLSGAVQIDWTNGAQASSIDFNWGTAGQAFGTGGNGAIGLTDGLSQFDSAYRVNFVNQNGAPVGELASVAIDENGFVVASYSNGETQKLFKIPLADFANPDQLLALSGNAFQESADSGAVNLAQAGSSGVGKIASSTLEASNVELADQLTDMIVAQRAYQANTKVISTSDQLLEELNRILQ